MEVLWYELAGRGAGYGCVLHYYESWRGLFMLTWVFIEVLCLLRGLVMPDLCDI